jgi:hypothetical protein
MPEDAQDAHAPSGELWWRLSVWPGKKNQTFGAEPRLAVWLRFNAKIGDVLTLRKLRELLGTSSCFKSALRARESSFERNACEWEGKRISRFPAAPFRAPG